MLDALVAYDTFLDRHDQAQAYILDLAIIFTPDFTHAYHLNIDEPFFAQSLYASDISPPIADFNFESMAANVEFENAAEQLLFLQNIALMWRLRIDNHIETIIQRLEAQ